MLPSILQEYLDTLRADVPNHPYSLACVDQGVKKVEGGIEGLLAEAASCSGIPGEELLKPLDFDKHDLDPRSNSVTLRSIADNRSSSHRARFR